MFLEHVWRSMSCFITSGECSKNLAFALRTYLGSKNMSWYDCRNAGTVGPCSKEMVRKSAADADRMAAVDALLKKAVAGVTRKD
eukprot:4059620-Pyramimonas_sp.AAC.1